MMGGISRRRLRQRIVAAGNHQVQRIVGNQVPQVPRTTARPGEIGIGRNGVIGNGTSQNGIRLPSLLLNGATSVATRLVVPTANGQHLHQQRLNRRRLHRRLRLTNP